MFTGIIEGTGEIKKIENRLNNKLFTIECDFINELKIDQSLAHNGVCLTIIDLSFHYYKVEAIEETLKKSNIGKLKEGDFFNLERAMKLKDRLDGHIVQGHVDTTAICKRIEKNQGSTIFTFRYEDNKFITVEKGSITVNGISLTLFNSKENEFSVAIIPYTFDNTNFKYIMENDTVNLEFDIVGKYIEKLFNNRYSI